MFTDRINRIMPSATLEMTSKAADLRRNNKPVYNMSVGEPDFSTPRNIQEAGMFAIQNGHTKYTPGGGTFDLKQAIIKKLSRDNSLNFDINQIVVSCGGKHSLYNACQALFEKGDEVILFTPYWVSFPDFVSVTGAKPIFVKTDSKNQNEPDFSDLEKKINNKTKGIIINSPSNPTGGVWSDNAIIQLLDFLKSYKDIWIFSDECYEQLTYGSKFKSIAGFDRHNSRIITFQSCSKTYAMTGWRIGYIAGHEGLVKAISKLQGQSTSCPNSIAQYAAIEALTGDQSCVEEMRNIFKERRDIILSELSLINKVSCEKPNGAFYVFPDFSKYLGMKDLKGNIINSSTDLSLYILDTTGVVTVAGDNFGAPGHIRFSYATSNKIITQAVELVNKTIKKLRF
ncbi:pyridoxal phosphate-dependent aminotransferase [Candidatus Marinimicrobia bacterium]|nr:pyridoxal phosphate-dependent aminotransferase [Candidatus Neomarinimicrobiota bacterium]